jgi:DNA-binding protein H-NS
VSQIEGRPFNAFPLFSATITSDTVQIAYQRNSHRGAGRKMNECDVKSMSVDELWIFRERIAEALIAKMSAAKRVLEDRLSKLDQKARSAIVVPPRRPYPKVRPKFQNPEELSETWAGRGKQPRWLRKQLRSGKRIDDFRIGPSVAA